MSPWRFDISLRPMQTALLAGLTLVALGGWWLSLRTRVHISPAAPPRDRIGQIDPRLNLHTASAAELACLPSLGRSLAEAIVRHRTSLAATGRHIESLDALAEAIHGIGPSTVRRIAPYLRLESPDRP